MPNLTRSPAFDHPRTYSMNLGKLSADHHNPDLEKYIWRGTLRWQIPTSICRVSASNGETLPEGRVGNSRVVT